MAPQRPCTSALLSLLPKERISEPRSTLGGPCGRKVPFRSQAESCWALQTFLSGGKRYASPLSARSSPGAPAQEPAGATQHPAAAAVQQKGLSFADLVGVKGRRSSLSGKKPGRPGAQKSHCFGAPATLTVGMVLTSPVNGGKPATAEKPAPDAAMDKLQAGEMPEGVAVAESAVREAPCIQPAGAVPASADSLPELQEHGGVKAGAVEVSQSRSESVQEGNGHSGADDAREGPSSSSELEAGPCQDQPGTSLEQVSAMPHLT